MINDPSQKQFCLPVFRPIIPPVAFDPRPSSTRQAAQMDPTAQNTGTHHHAREHVRVFNPRSQSTKAHESIAVGGKCYRYASAGSGRFRAVFRCCDDSCSARVHFSAPTDYELTGNHLVCSFDHESELRRRVRLELAHRIYSQNKTDSPSEVVRKMEVTMRLTPEEKRSVKTFVSAQRKIEMGMTHACGVDVQIPDSLKTVKRDESIEDEDVSFLLYDSVEDTTKPRIVIFSSAAMRRIASTASEFFADGTYHIVPNGFATL